VRNILTLAFTSLALLGVVVGCSTSARRATAIPSLGTPAVVAPSTKLQLLELQASGRLPAPAPRSAMLRELAAVGQARPRVAFRGVAGLGLWASSSTYEYVFGQTASGGKTVSAVDVAANGCDVNVGIKVDHDSNLWVACQADPTFEHGLVQEYTNGTLAGTYAEGCPSKSCSQWYSYGFDVAADSFNHIFAGLTHFQMTKRGVTTAGSGFEWWPLTSTVSSKSAVPPKSAAPSLIALPINDPVTAVYFFDVDSIGNIWFDYEGCTTTCGFGLAEIASPTKSPIFTSVLAPGTIGYPGGVYVSKGGAVLNVTDQESRTTSQYKLPWKPSETPFNVLGPTYVNDAGCGDPVSGGFNQNETRQADGDQCGWLDVGKLKKKGKSSYSAVTNPNFAGLAGAAYVPSDK
jgi:hypothetical protein